MENKTRNLIDEMYTEEARLKSFKNWPFGEDMKCSASKMAEAGFFHCPTEKEPDLVQCYVCYKELDGWEANDEPWDEHFSHSKICVFAKIHKAQKDLTIAEIFDIEAQRKINKNKRRTTQKVQEFRSLCEKIEDFATEALDELSDLKAKKNKKK